MSDSLKERAIDSDLEQLENLRLALLSCEDTDKFADYELLYKFAMGLTEKFPDSALVWRCVGVAAYDLFIKARAGADEVISILARSLELDPYEPFALLTLAFVLYDLQKYDDALNVLQRIDQFFFLDSVNWKWRGFKVRELILACRLRLGDESIKPEEIENFIADMKGTDFEDIPDLQQLLTAVENKVGPLIFMPADLDRIRRSIAQHQNRYFG